MLNKDASSWVWIKGLIFFLLLTSVRNVISNPEVFPLYKQVSESGQVFIQIQNRSLFPVYCYIRGTDYFQSFYLQPEYFSRWYIEPYGYYEWWCQ